MKKSLSIVLSAFVITTAFAQNKSENTVASRSFFAKGGGAGIAFSANFDTRFSKSSNPGFEGRIGVGFVSAYEYNTSWYGGDKKCAITFPIQVNYIFGKANSAHSFEVGSGVTYVTKKLEIMNFYDDRRTQVLGTFSFMYRHQPASGGFSWRAGFTPLFGKDYLQPFGA